MMLYIDYYEEPEWEVTDEICPDCNENLCVAYVGYLPSMEDYSAVLKCFNCGYYEQE